MFWGSAIACVGLCNHLFMEMVSYMSGPLLGNAQVGFLASITSIQCAILIGGIACTIAVCLSISLLPAFWKYRAHDINFQETRV